MWHETNRQNDGTIRGRPASDAPEEWVLSGPHFLWESVQQNTEERMHGTAITMSSTWRNCRGVTCPGRTNPGVLPEEYAGDSFCAWDGRKVTEFFPVYKQGNDRTFCGKNTYTVDHSTKWPILNMLWVVFKNKEDMLVLLFWSTSIV
jgi:hypothetical protein